ncbi:hypothetical protein ABT001_02260 [Streptomyces sp. NPDC002793]|uniref:hypothetical protein n=1 Tax=Streptomyces sp. NPDC002793 TaxID=3154432 RepID=UPI00331A6C2F
MGHGGTVIEERTTDHREVEELFWKFEVQPVGGQQRRKLACTPQVLDALGDKIRTAKKTAPTRPHPSAPDTPPGNRLLGPGAGLVDRARDLLTGRGKG